MGKTALHVLAKRSTPYFGVREKEREKRKKILKMCVQKLRDIDDPETVLCRAVLINNTFKTLKYTYRHMFRPEPVAEPVYEAESDDNEEEDNEEEDASTDESSNSEDEGVPASSSDNDSDIDNTEEPVLDPPQPSSDSPVFSPHTELDSFNQDNTCCDMKNFNTQSIVHSLMMPALLSPQIEDITNCSFYDSFSGDAVPQDLVDLNDNANKVNDITSFTTADNADTDLTASFRFSVVDNSQDMSDSNYNVDPVSSDLCPKSCVQSDLGHSLIIDNLLTEIVQA